MVEPSKCQEPVEKNIMLRIYCWKEYWLKKLEKLESRYDIIASPYGICYLLLVTYYRRSTQFFGRREGERKF
jgi:hypothetical protein